MLTTMADSQTGVLEIIETESRDARTTPWNVVVHNDPINLMSYVTMVFQRVFGYPRTQAETLMREVHYKGRSIVWTGAREQAETYAQKLQAHHLLTSLEVVDG